jgi:hypothetical protein
MQEAGVAVAILLFFGMLIGGVTSCTMHETAQITKRVKAACTGDLNDAARSSACTLALTQRERR